MAKTTTKTTAAKKKVPAKSPLEKAVAATLTSGKTLDKAKLKHASNLAALKKLEKGT